MENVSVVARGWVSSQKKLFGVTGGFMYLTVEVAT